MSNLIACNSGMVYDKIQKPWLCVCDRTLYTQVNNLCVLNSQATAITSKYSESNAINIQFKDELEVYICFTNY